MIYQKSLTGNTLINLINTERRNNMNTCPDCGCRMYNGVCTNCHEEVYIAEQYTELGMSIPESFNETFQKSDEYSKREDVQRELRKE